MTAAGATLRWLAFYLPQFHPIPENDAWWGTGFTEWRNVVQARPRFRGHYQPHIPADLGFYDLRLPETRLAQAELASAYGINGFVYYHYWFKGRRLLHRPIDDVLATGEPDFPFCLCWANENWTRVWDGGEDEILLRQEYSSEDDLNHIRWFAEVASDRRYACVDGRPIFLVYRALDLTDVRRTIDSWRQECDRLGVPSPYLIRVEGFHAERGDPRALGFDASVEFQPDTMGSLVYYGTIPGRLWRKLFARRHHMRLSGYLRYEDLMAAAAARPAPSWPRYRCVMPGWDNSARRPGGGRVVTGSTPALYERWVRSIVESFTPESPNEDLAFVNAWNEWAEGNHLEPDLRWGSAYLEAHRRAISAQAASSLNRTSNYTAT